MRLGHEGILREYGGGRWKMGMKAPIGKEEVVVAFSSNSHLRTAIRGSVVQVQHTFMMEHGVLIQGSDWTEKAKGPKSCSEFSTPAPRFKKEAGAQQGPYRTGPIWKRRESVRVDY